MGKRALFWGTLAIAVAVAAARSVPACAACATVIVVTICFGLYCRRRIAGITGDTLGANLQLSESAALLAFLWTEYSR
jgi:cobalamin synthase